MALTEQQTQVIERYTRAVQDVERARHDYPGIEEVERRESELRAAHAALIEVVEVAQPNASERGADDREIEVGALVRHRMGGKVGEVVEVTWQGEHAVARVRYTFTSGEGTCRYVTSDLVRV
jgi:hypothetical protein